MNSKLNTPDDIAFGQKGYSWRKDFKVNGWLFVAAVISGLCDIMFRHVVKQWPMGWQTAIVVAEFLAIWLWTRDVRAWVHGMDELHRRISVSSILFAVCATFFVMMFWHGLDRAGLFNVIFRQPGKVGWDVCTPTHGFLLMILFYIGGQAFFNRRYK
ncbi:MAG TPA: hypothetical protein VMH87_16020 [Pseudomonadales bacterium]|nr:hypothetical protein [Pseudomonadales bacterium]